MNGEMLPWGRNRMETNQFSNHKATWKNFGIAKIETELSVNLGRGFKRFQ